MMFSSGPPEHSPYQIFLTESGLNDRIYAALENDDLSEVVVTVMDILRHTSNFDYKTDAKSEEESDIYRRKGNEFYTAKKFRRALECYNKALLYAPENSHAMKLAYSNRSALLFTVKAHTASINDIETVFSMGCTDYALAQRLKQRKSESLQHAKMENLQMQMFAGSFAQNFFKLDVKRHPQINCASTDVDVITESGMPKIVAAKDIPVGRLAALEKPFVSGISVDNYYISCHYCHKLSLNLIPCDTCCIALFCDEKCKSQCKKEYHNIECKIVSSHYKTVDGPSSAMALRAALKMRQMCKSWTELINASYNIGENRMRTSSVSDIYDVKSKFSLLSYNNSSHFVYGERYNQSFRCGMILLHALANVPSFFPQNSDEKDAAIRALARIMMHLYTSYRKIETFGAAKDVHYGIVTTNTEHNFGCFSFAGKLKHSCDANLLTMGINNQVALLTIRPIKKGEEMTISFIGHYFENLPAKRQYRLFCFTQEICKCQTCTENWNSRHFRKLKLNVEQEKAYRNWAAIMRKINILNRDEKVYNACCEGLAGMKGAESTDKHHDIYKEFRQLTTLCQFIAGNNLFIQKDDDEIEELEILYR